MEASSNPLPPLDAVSTVYPKLSRKAFSQSSTSWLSSMQRTTLFSSFAATVERIGQLHNFIMTVSTLKDWSQLLTSILTNCAVFEVSENLCIAVPGVIEEWPHTLWRPLERNFGPGGRRLRWLEFVRLMFLVVRGIGKRNCIYHARLSLQQIERRHSDPTACASRGTRRQYSYVSSFASHPGKFTVAASLELFKIGHF